MISVFYTGDRRGNPDVMQDNHREFLRELALLDDVQVNFYTKDYPERGRCPFDEGGADTHYRRGQGGAVQVWDFYQSVERSQGDIVVKLRTDVWITKSSLKVLLHHIEQVVKDQRDIVFFGSDLVNDNVGIEHRTIEIDRYEPARIQDFVVAARKNKLTPGHQVIADMLAISPKKVKSGNKTFRALVPDGARAATVLCHLWLIRQRYDTMPSDYRVAQDYIQSYITDGKNLDGVLQPALDWLETYK
jgi:hypothetical protein